MAGYRCYFLDDRDRIESAENFLAGGLDEAIDYALALLGRRPHHHDFELWQGALRLYSSREQPPRHQCHIYDGPPSAILPMMAAIVSRKLREGMRCLYLNSPIIVASMRSYLAAEGVDVNEQVAKGALVLSSAQELLPDFSFDSKGMLAALEAAVEQALSDGYAGLWAAGDMSWELGPHSSADELLDYELGLEEIFRRRPALSGICQYHVDTLPRELVRAGLTAHRCVFVNETLSRMNGRFLTLLGDGGSQGLDAAIDDLCRAARAAG